MQIHWPTFRCPACKARLFEKERYRFAQGVPGVLYALGIWLFGWPADWVVWSLIGAVFVVSTVIMYNSPLSFEPERPPIKMDA